MGEARATLGAVAAGDGKTRFRVWAPDRRRVEVAVEEGGRLRKLPLQPLPGGYFGGTLPIPVGGRYRYCLDGGECFPDPCSRFQPDGPHGPSEIVDPSFPWTDGAWQGLAGRGQVLYELHVGTFTPEGTYAGVASRLADLRELGVTCIELMPLATCPGRFNWGYDGVDLFAPTPAYGRPEALRRLVDRAHALGLGIILDVVYNHLGPDGNYLAQYARGYFTRKYQNDWGEPLDFEGEQARPVRELLVENARMWIAEYHLDGLRLDATQNVYDASEEHVIAELSGEARAAAGSRQLLIVAENEPQDIRCVTSPERGGFGADALWIDDFHHAARVALTGNAEAYCQDYCGTSQELLSCVLRNSLFQGQWYDWQDKRRGTPLHRVEPWRAVFFLQNHDQLANTLRGLRFHELCGPDLARAMTALLLLAPQTPMLFQGQEFFSSSPFLYFVDHAPELMRAIRKGRDAFLSQFSSAKCALEGEHYDVPCDERAFRASTLDWGERDRHSGALALHADLLRLRREDPCFAAQELRAVAGATLSPRSLVLRWFGDCVQGEPGRPAGEVGDRLLLLNLGPDQKLDPCPEPLLAPPPGRAWRQLLSSQQTRYGGIGACAPSGERRWVVPGHCALVLTSEMERDRP